MADPVPAASPALTPYMIPSVVGYVVGTSEIRVYLVRDVDPLLAEKDAQIAALTQDQEDFSYAIEQALDGQFFPDSLRSRTAAHAVQEQREQLDALRAEVETLRHARADLLAALEHCRGALKGSPFPNVDYSEADNFAGLTSEIHEVQQTLDAVLGLPAAPKA